MGLMALCAALWSIGGLFVKLISWDPMLIAGMRSLIAAAATGIYILLIRQKLYDTAVLSHRRSRQYLGALYRKLFKDRSF